MNRSIAMLLIGLIFGGGIGFTIAAGAGVTLDGHDHSEHLLEETGAVAHDHDKITVLPEGPDAPTLDVDVIKDGTGWNLRVITTNFTMTPEKIGTEHVPGEGHGHVYLNEIKQARLYGEWYHIDKVPDGDVALRVTLNSNDHSALAVGDQPLEATITLPDS
ncbi:MAG: hypothetical protein HKN27_11505 [Silicimonas sp.]|nr:hypothetical protein [Silicimonas sp.]